MIARRPWRDDVRDRLSDRPLRGAEPVRWDGHERPVAFPVHAGRADGPVAAVAAAGRPGA